MDWNKIKIEYIKGGTSYRKLAAKHGVPLSTLKRIAHDDNWVGLREQCKAKSATKIVEIESDKQAERMKKLLTVSDKLLMVVEDVVEKLQARELMLDKSALKSISATIKDIKDIQSIKSELDMEEQKARIAILKKNAEAETNGGTEVSVTFGMDEEQSKWAE